MTKKDTRSIILIVAGVAAVVWLLSMAGIKLPTALPTTPTENTTPNTNIQTAGSRTVLSVIAGLEYGNRFEQLLASTGVGPSLTGSGPYTVFVSTDGAFSRLVPGTVNNLSAAGQKRLVQYHVVSGKKLDIDALKSGEATALSKDILNFQVSNNNEIYVNSGKVVETYNASNGVVYVINAVLLPPVPIQ